LSASDDELDAELRRLFGDERLTVRPKSDAPEAIVAGARRIRRRRTAMISASGAVVAVALVGASLTFGPFRTQDNVAAMNTSALKTATLPQTVAGSAPPVSPTQSPVPGGESAPATSVPGTPPAGGKLTTSPNSPPKTTPTTGKRVPQFITTGGLLSPAGFGNLKLDSNLLGAPPADVTVTETPTSTACTGYNFSGEGVPGPGFAATSPMTQPYGGGGYVVKIVPSGPVHTPEGIGKGSTKDDVKQKYVGAGENESGLYAPASATSVYRFTVDSANVVQAILLEKTNNDC
jgi:hypothetical protein